MAIDFLHEQEDSINAHWLETLNTDEEINEQLEPLQESLRNVRHHIENEPTGELYEDERWLEKRVDLLVQKMRSNHGMVN